MVGTRGGTPHGGSQSRGRRRMSLERTNNMTFAEAKEEFLRAARDGRVPGRSKGAVPGAMRSLNEARANQVIRRVEFGVAHASGKCSSALDAVDISPLLLDLDDNVWHGAEHLSASGKRVAVSDARLFASTLLGRDVAKRNWIRISPSMFEPAWRPLAHALVSLGGWSAGGRSKKTTLADLHRLAKAAAARNILRPEDLPSDSAEILDWARQDYWDGTDEGERTVQKKRGNLKAGLVAYRRARRALGSAGEHLPPCTAARMDREWGIGALENLDDLLQTAFHRLAPEEQERLRHVLENPSRRSMVDLISVLAPDVGDALATYLERGANLAIPRQPDYENKVVGAVSRIIATMIREKIDPATLSFSDLWLSEAPTRAAERPASGRVSRYAVETAETEATVCLLHHILDASLPNRIAGSTLTLPPAVRDGRAKHYPDSAFNDVCMLKYVALRVLKPIMSKQRATDWSKLEAAHKSLIEHMSSTNKVSPSSGRVDKQNIPLNFGQLVCVALWYLRRRVQEADKVLAEHLCDPRRRDGSHRMLTLQERLYVALEEYAVVAVIAADGLRCKNYAGAIAGYHIIPKPIVDSQGHWVGFSGVSTRFCGDDCPSVRLKITTKRKSVRQRQWTLSPGIVDMKLFFRYWTEVRQDRLRKAGLIAPKAQLDVNGELTGQGERFAVFVSDHTASKKASLPSKKYALVRNGPEGQRTLVSPGNRTDASIRAIWARVIHEVARDVLRVPGIPATLAECRKQGSLYRGLTGPHGDRSLAAWHFGGLLGDWGFAEEMTNDSYDTLRNNYAVLPEHYARNRGSRTVFDPELYAGIVDWMIAPKSLAGELNWEAFWAAFTPLRWDPDSRTWVQVFKATDEEMSRLRAALAGEPDATISMARVRRGKQRDLWGNREVA